MREPVKRQFFHENGLEMKVHDVNGIGVSFDRPYSRTVQCLFPVGSDTAHVIWEHHKHIDPVTGAVFYPVHYRTQEEADELLRSTEPRLFVVARERLRPSDKGRIDRLVSVIRAIRTGRMLGDYPEISCLEELTEEPQDAA